MWVRCLLLPTAAPFEEKKDTTSINNAHAIYGGAEFLKRRSG
jgi:hypothetical protein